MVDKNELFEKSLHKNYGTVQKKENAIAELNVKLAKEFSSNTMGLTKTLNKEMKSHQVRDKEIKNKYKEKLKEIKINNAAAIKDIENRIKKLDIEYKNTLIIKLDKQNNPLQTLDDILAELNTNNEKLINDINKQYKREIATNEKEKLKIIKQGEKDILSLVNELKETQEKYESLVVDLNEKREASAEKLTILSEKEIKKINKEIEKNQLKIDEMLLASVQPYEKKLADLEENILNEENKFKNKENAIRATLDTRVTRHQKFLKKAIAEGDNRSAKEHKRNIISLEKEMEKELKLLLKEHQDKHIILSKIKNDFITENNNKIANIKIEFVKFKEDKLYQIEVCKAKLTNDLQMLILNTRKQLEEELNVYNEYFANNKSKQAEIIRDKDIELQKQFNIQATLKIKFDEDISVNEAEYQESIAVKKSEFETNKQPETTEQKLAKVEFDINLAKLNTDKKIIEIELPHLIKINEKNELIEYHINDFNKQESVNKEYLDYQNDYSNMYINRAKYLSEYEELEMNNRIDLKLSFLEKERKYLLTDFEKISQKIKQVYETEKAMFYAEINNVSKDAVEKLELYKTDLNNQINALVDKKNTLNLKAYKKEIKILDKEISDKKHKQLHGIEKRQDEINTKISIFNKGLEHSKNRMINALNEVTYINDSELSRLDQAIELLNEERDKELKNIQERFLTTTSVINKFFKEAELRNTNTKEENQIYKNNRIAKEEEVIKKINLDLDYEKRNIVSELEQLLKNYEMLKEEINEETNNYRLKVIENLEIKARDYEEQINEYHIQAKKLLIDQENIHKINVAKFEVIYENHILEVTEELKIKKNEYKLKIIEIENALNEEAKSFDLAKKQAHKIYNAMLEKELSLVNQKLQHDLRNI